MMHSTLQGGTLELNSKTPLQLGVTCWRTLVTYVPQTRVHPPGTPAEFYFSVQVLRTRLAQVNGLVGRLDRLYQVNCSDQRCM